MEILMGRRGKSCSGTVHTEGEPTKASTTAVTKDSSNTMAQIITLQQLSQLAAPQNGYTNHFSSTARSQDSSSSGSNSNHSNSSGSG